MTSALYRCMSELYLARLPGWYRVSKLINSLRQSTVPKSVYASKHKLNLGSGDRPLSSYVNVDALAKFNPDVVCEVSQLTFAQDNKYDLLRASHILEHFEYPGCRQVLAEWRRVIRPGGYLIVCVPDFTALSWRTVLKPSGLDLNETAYKNGWINGLFALDLPPQFRHKTVFTQRSLVRLLSESGFHVVGRLNPFMDEPYVFGIDDDSGTRFSLNLAAIKV